MLASPFAAMSVAVSPWIVRWSPRPRATVRLVCLAAAGGGASTFRDWPAMLPPAIEVCAIRLPGREDRIGERPLRDVMSIVTPLAQAVAGIADRPFAVYGHSLGALVGFELLRRLESMYRQPAALFIAAGALAPQVARSRPPIYALPDSALKREIVRLNGTPPDVLADSELMDMCLPTLRADFEVVDTYAYRSGPRLVAPILAVGGRDDPEVPDEALLEWRTQTMRGFVAQQLPGDHFFVISHQRALLDLVARAVERGLA